MRTSEICRLLGPKQTANLAPRPLAASPIPDAPRKNWVRPLRPAKAQAAGSGSCGRTGRSASGSCSGRAGGPWLFASRAVDVFPDPVLLLLFAIGAFAMRSAGCIYNDILDRDIDAKVARTQARPLASGQISVKVRDGVDRWRFASSALAVLIQFNLFAICLGFASVGIVLIYPLMKRVTFWPQAFLGLAFSWGALMGWAAIFGSVALAPVILYASAVAWTIGYDTIYAHQDKEDDEVIGLKSTALKFGDHTPRWLSLFYGITWGGLAFSGWLVGAGLLFFVGMILAGAHLIWQIATLDIDDSQNCLDRFRSNHGFGAIVFFALVLDVIPVALSSFALTFS